MAYIDGLLDMATAVQHEFPEIRDRDTVCPLGGRFTARRIRETFLGYMKDRPEESENKQQDVTYRALVDAFPCNP